MCRSALLFARNLFSRFRLLQRSATAVAEPRILTAALPSSTRADHRPITTGCDERSGTASIRVNERPLTDLFHLVKRLVPERQQLVTIAPDQSVSEALRVMREHNFSQLPVTLGDE